MCSWRLPCRFIKEDYLQQNSFTKYDKYCPFYKSLDMMRNICTFHRLATGGQPAAWHPCLGLRCADPATAAAAAARPAHCLQFIGLLCFQFFCRVFTV
jgi:hypothetical protein